MAPSAECLRHEFRLTSDRPSDGKVSILAAERRSGTGVVGESVSVWDGGITRRGLVQGLPFLKDVYP